MPMKTRVIAIIDDDKICRLVVKKQIESNPSSTHILEFDNGRSTLDYLLENRNNPEALPDLIFLDLMMPIMDGWGFLNGLGEFVGDLIKVTKIFILTSSIDPEDKLRAERFDLVNRFINKPVNLRTIQRIMNQAESFGHQAA